MTTPSSTPSYPSGVCKCAPQWMRTELLLVHEENKQNCCVCKRSLEGLQRGAGTVAIPCLSKPGRVHFFTCLFCDEGTCPQTFFDKYLRSERYNKFFQWIPISSAHPEFFQLQSKFADEVRKRFGTSTAIKCENFKCGNVEWMGPPQIKFKSCGGCKKAVYCCKECQAVDWTEGNHRLGCKVYQGKATQEETDDFMNKYRRCVSIKEFFPGPAPPGPQFESPCDCFDDIDKHRYQAQIAGTCANPGCFNKTPELCPLTFNTVGCRNPQSTTIFHVFAERFCSNKCHRKGMTV